MKWGTWPSKFFFACELSMTTKKLLLNNVVQINVGNLFLVGLIVFKVSFCSDKFIQTGFSLNEPQQVVNIIISKCPASVAERSRA